MAIPNNDSSFDGCWETLLNASTGESHTSYNFPPLQPQYPPESSNIQQVFPQDKRLPEYSVEGASNYADQGNNNSDSHHNDHREYSNHMSRFNMVEETAKNSDRPSPGAQIPYGMFVGADGKPDQETQHHKPADGGYICHLCGVVIKHREDFSRHWHSVHTGKRRVTCEACGTQFSRKDNMRRHQQHSCKMT